MMVHILFTRFFDIRCNVFQIPIHVCTMMQIPQSRKPVLDFNVKMLPTYSLELDYF